MCGESYRTAQHPGGRAGLDGARHGVCCVPLIVATRNRWPCFPFETGRAGEESSVSPAVGVATAERPPTRGIRFYFRYILPLCPQNTTRRPTTLPYGTMLVQCR